jgi:hypothetical protein
MNAIAWLRRRQPGFDELKPEAVEQISQFSLLWTYFEAKVLETNATAAKIVAVSNEIVANGADQRDEVTASLQHFRERCVEEDRFNYHFDQLHFRQSDRQQLVADVLLGKSEAKQDQLAAALLIVLRLRNNLFHGLKWAYELRDQQENFRLATELLVAACELHDHYAARV